MFGENGRFLASILVLIFLCDRTSSECTQLTPCSCIFPDGQGYSLSQLANSSNLTVSDANHSFYYHPCTNSQFSFLNETHCSEGNGVSLCVRSGNETFSLGTVEETKIVYSDISKEPVLILHHETNETTIELSCCNMCKSHLLLDPVNENKNYHFILKSPYACKTLLHSKGLSTGSLLLIYFFIFSGIYFIGGAITLKLLRGATGWEMVPNHQFWRELPSLVRDGITFTFNCCRPDSYDRI